MAKEEEEPKFEELIEQLRKIELHLEKQRKKRFAIRADNPQDYWKAVFQVEKEEREENKQIGTNLEQIFEKLKDTRAVETLITALKDEVVHVRRHAAQILGEIRDSRAVEPLIELLTDNYNVQAAEALGKLGGERAIEALISALKVENISFRANIVEILKKQEKTIVVETLHSALNDENNSFKVNVIEILEKIDSERTLEVLIKVLKDEDRLIRIKAAEVLGNLKDPRAVEALIKALKDEDRVVRRKTAEALQQLGDARAEEPFTQILRDNKEDSGLIKIASETLRQLEEKKTLEQLILGEEEFTTDKLVNLLDANNEELRVQAAITLGKLGTISDMDSIIQGIKHYSSVSAERINAKVNLLNKVSEYFYDLIDKGEKEALFPYLQVVDFCMDGSIWSIYVDETDYNYSHGSKLKKTLTDDDFDRLFKLLRSKINGGVKFLIASILGAIGDKRAVEPIIALLKAKEDQVVRSAFYALGRIGDRRAAKAVITKMREIEGWKTNWPEFIEGVGFGGDWVLDIGMFADEFFDIIMKLDAIEEFVEIFKDAPTFFISVFMEIVEHHSYNEVKRFFDALKEDPDYLIEALMGYMLHFDELSKGLRSIKKDIVGLKQSITEEKLRLELEDIVKLLEETEKEMIEREEKSGKVRDYIQKEIDKLQKSKSKERIQFLEELYSYLQSDNTMEIYYALCALEKLQLSETIERIIPLLEHWHRFTRRDAIEILGKMGDKSAIEPLEQLLEKEQNTLTKERIHEALNKLKKLEES